MSVQITTRGDAVTEGMKRYAHEKGEKIELLSSPTAQDISLPRWGEAAAEGAQRLALPVRYLRLPR